MNGAGSQGPAFFMPMFYPIFIIIASLALGAPSSLSESVVIAKASQNPETLGAYVEEYFVETPILAHIAECESSMRHFGKDGSVLRGTTDKDDIGVMQINTRYHEAEAEELGLNLYSLNGNLGYAKYLYGHQGTKPWAKSQFCWGTMAQK